MFWTFMLIQTALLLNVHIMIVGQLKTSYSRIIDWGVHASMQQASFLNSFFQPLLILLSYLWMGNTFKLENHFWETALEGLKLTPPPLPAKFCFIILLPDFLSKIWMYLFGQRGYRGKNYIKMWKVPSGGQDQIWKHKKLPILRNFQFLMLTHL